MKKCISLNITSTQGEKQENRGSAASKMPYSNTEETVIFEEYSLHENVQTKHIAITQVNSKLSPHMKNAMTSSSRLFSSSKIGLPGNSLCFLTEPALESSICRF